MKHPRYGINPAHVDRYLDAWERQINGFPSHPSIPLYRRAIMAAYAGAYETAARIIEQGFFKSKPAPLRVLS